MQGFIDKNYKTLFTIFGAVLVGSAFYTGFLEGKQTTASQPVALLCKDNVLDKLSIPLENIANGVTAHADAEPAKTEGNFVGSKNSTKYYAPSCAAVKRIKPANYRWFDTAEDAKIQGYTPGKC
jgi:hypothetical protein